MRDKRGPQVPELEEVVLLDGTMQADRTTIDAELTTTAGQGRLDRSP